MADSQMDALWRRIYGNVRQIAQEEIARALGGVLQGGKVVMAATSGRLAGTRIDSTGASDGHVLTADGAGGAAWEASGAVTDAAAIHDNVDGEIHAIAEKGSPVDDDELVIEDSAASWAKKRVKLSNLPGGGGGGGSVPGEVSAAARIQSLSLFR